MKDTLKFYNDFPKQGIVFVDIIPFLQDKKTFRQLVDELGKCLTAPNIAAPEARGFLFTAPLLVTDPRVENIIPIRKSGKLPFAEGDLCEALTALDAALDGLQHGLTSELLSEDIRAAINHLGEITGEITSDDILQNIFSKFCIGK